MSKQPFGSTGAHVVRVGQGTWQMELDDRAGCIASLRRGLELGMTHVDTAELYGSGAVETLVGEALRGRRDEVFLVSKVLPWHASRRGTVEACEASLARLGTDHLDLYVLHWPGEVPLEESIAGLEDLCRAGKIRAWGVSNFDVDDLAEAVRLAGPGRVACNQVLYHLGERSIEHAVLPACERHGVALVGYSPFGSGDFPGPATAGRRVLDSIAAAHTATATRVALAFLVRRAPLFTIPKASRAAHVEDNAAAAALTLSAAELARIEAAFPLGRPRRGVPTL
jgi:diketogulonate reductase-like aldo/keto reductase